VSTGVFDSITGADLFAHSALKFDFVVETNFNYGFFIAGVKTKTTKA
jgi:hypothetical protein